MSFTKHATLVAAALAFVVAWAGLLTSSTQAQRRTSPHMRRGTQQAKLQPPKDRSRVRASYVINEQPVEVTEGEFYDTYKMLEGQEQTPNRMITAARVTEHLLLYAEAQAMGCALSPEEIDALNPMTGIENPEVSKAFKERLQSMGIAEDVYLRYVSEKRAIQRLRSLFANSARPLSTDIYDSWKDQHQNYQIAYIDFSALTFETEMKKSPPSEAVLKKFYSTNHIVRNHFRRPMVLSADIIYFDSEKADTANTNGANIDRKDALAYFQRNRKRLMTEIPSAERHKLEIRPDTSLDKIVTPFQILLPKIIKEMSLRPLIDKAFAEARAAGSSWDPEATAKKYSLSYINIEKATRNEIVSQNRRFGPQIFNHLWNTANGSLGKEIQSHGNIYFFWRLREKRISSFPTFQEAMGLGLLDKFYEFESYDRSSRAAQAAMKAINAEVDKEAGKEMAAIKAKYDKMAADEIKAKNITKPNEKQLVIMRYNARANQERTQLRNRLRPKHFDAWAAKVGHKVVEYGPFEFRPGYHDRQRIKDPEELKNSFIHSYWGFRNLHPGEVLGNVASDRVSRNHFIFKLIKKTSPEFERMPAIDYLRQRSNLTRAKVYNFNLRWTYKELVNRMQWIER